MGPGLGQSGVERIGKSLVGVVEDRPEEAEQDHRNQHHNRDDGKPVARELTDREAPAAGDNLHLPALGHQLVQSAARSREHERRAPHSSICWEGVSGSVKANPRVSSGDGDVGE